MEEFNGLNVPLHPRSNKSKLPSPAGIDLHKDGDMFVFQYEIGHAHQQEDADNYHEALHRWLLPQPVHYGIGSKA